MGAGAVSADVAEVVKTKLYWFWVCVLMAVLFGAVFQVMLLIWPEGFPWLVAWFLAVICVRLAKANA